MGFKMMLDRKHKKLWGGCWQPVRREGRIIKKNKRGKKEIKKN